MKNRVTVKNESDNRLDPLPDELISLIISELNVRDTASISLTSRRFNNISTEHIFSSPLQILKFLGSSDKNIAAKVEHLRALPIYQKICEDMKNGLDTPSKTLLFALLTDNIYNIDPKKLDDAIDAVSSGIKSGKIPKEIQRLLYGLQHFTRLALNDRKFFKSFNNITSSNDKKILIDKLSWRELEYINLSGVDFSQSELNHIYFQNINLENANFEYTTLHYASFEGANVKDSNFHQAKLQTANILKSINVDSVNFICSGLDHIKLSMISQCIFGPNYEQDPYRRDNNESFIFRNFIANNVANLAWKISQKNPKEAMEFLDMAARHPIFKFNYFENKETPNKFHRVLNLFRRTSSQAILQDMKRKIEVLKVSQKKKIKSI